VLGGGANFLDHLFDHAGVGKGSTGHNLIVTVTGTVGVKVFLRNAALSEVTGSGGVLSDLTSWGDMISGDGVTHVQEAVSTLEVFDGLKLILSGLEEWKVVDIG